MALPSTESIEWIFDSAGWWIEATGGFSELERTKIVRPTEDDFPVDEELEDDELAQDYLAFAMEHAGMSDWTVEMVPIGSADVAEALRGMPHHMTSAPVAADPGEPIPAGDPLPIPYEPSVLDDPPLLVASIARGLSHYLLQSLPDRPPHDDEQFEYLVDLGAVLMGFGIFLANAAFRFEQHQSGGMIGWGFSRQGALNQVDLSYALAAVALLLDEDQRTLTPYLSANPRSYFKSAAKHIAKKRRTDLDRLRNLRGLSRGPYR